MIAASHLAVAAVVSLLFALLVATRRLLTGPSGSPAGLNRATMVQALTRLGVLAQAEGHTLTLVVVGGAAMVLRYNARLSTQDVDAFFVTPPERSETRMWAERVAREIGLPIDWLNDGAKGFMQGVTYGPLLLEAPGIKVFQVGSEQLLAMKLSAWRGELDEADAVVVLGELTQRYLNKEALWNAIAPYVTHFRAQYAFEELWEGRE